MNFQCSESYFIGGANTWTDFQKNNSLLFRFSGTLKSVEHADEIFFQDINVFMFQIDLQVL